MRRHIAVLLLVLSASAAFVALHSSSVAAVSSGCYFGNGQCSISGNGDYGTNDIFTGRSGPTPDVLASVRNAKDRKAAFISFIKSRFNGSAHNKTGAQFIIANMTPGVSGRANSGDLDQWVTLMQQDNVTVTVDNNVSVSQTSWYVPGKNDVIHDTPYEGGARVRDVIYVKQSGKIVAELEISCGNLTAKHAKLESSGWEIKPTSSVTPTQVKPSQVIHWTHKAQNLGPEKTDKDVAWEVWQYIKSSPGAPNTGGTKPASGTIKSGAGKGYTMTKATSYTAKDADVGKYVCQYIRVKPWKDKDGDSWKYSDLKCAKVTKNPVSTSSCDPIIIKVTPTDRTWDGKTVPVTVVSYLNGAPYHTIGTTTTTRTFNITYPHTTGDVYEIHYKIPRYAYERDPVYDGDGNLVGYTYKYKEAQDIVAQTVGPCYDYNIRPTVDTDVDAAEIGTAINVTSMIENSELSGKVEGNSPPPSKTDGSVKWKLTALVYAPGSGIDSKSGPVSSGSDTCDYFTDSGRISCDTVDSWSNSLKSGEQVTKQTVYSMADDIKAGSRICFAVTVEKPTQEDDPAYRHSNLKCVRVGKRPKVQIHGSDLRTRGSSLTGASTIKGQTYGSWVEYGGLSLGDDNALGSGAGLKGGNAADLSGRSVWSLLTFANDGSYGHYGTLPPVQQVEQIMKNRGLCTSEVGSKTISGATISKGESIVLCASGTVTISGDIQQDGGSISKLEDIPQMMILAKDINIEANVGQVDAWLVATGTINTCSNESGQTVTSCDEQLVVNGPVMANKLVLKRTYGADGSDKDTPAEIFNMRPDSYLWLYSGMGKLGSNTAVETVQITEVPPRF